jgi:neuropeptide FF receptor 2
MCCDRYKAVHYPKTTKMTLRTATIAMLITWATPAALFVPWLFVYREKTFDISVRYKYVACHAHWPAEAVGQAFTVGVVMLTCYLLPLVCIGIFYVLIATRVQSRRQGAVVGRLGSGSAAAASIRRSTARLLRMLVVVVVLFAVSWLPLYAVQLRHMFVPASHISADEKHIVKTYVVPIAQWLGAANSCVNPFVYCYFNCGFRGGVIEVFRRIAAALGLSVGARRRSSDYQRSSDVTGAVMAVTMDRVDMETTVNGNQNVIRRGRNGEDCCPVETACSVIYIDSM